MQCVNKKVSYFLQSRMVEVESKQLLPAGQETYMNNLVDNTFVNDKKATSRRKKLYVQWPKRLLPRRSNIELETKEVSGRKDQLWNYGGRHTDYLLRRKKLK